jgi:hypothetical protein
MSRPSQNEIETGRQGVLVGLVGMPETGSRGCFRADFAHAQF